MAPRVIRPYIFLRTFLLFLGEIIMRTNLPTINLGRIVLREINEFDYLDYYDIGRDEITTKYLNWGPFKHPSEALWVIKNIFKKRIDDGIPIGYAICYLGKMIGVIDFHSYQSKINSCEIGYILHRNFWNLGIMKSCLRAATMVGFNHLELDKIIVGHTTENIASKRVIEASGYKYEYQQLVNMKGKDDIAYYYAMYRYEYLGGE